MLLSILIFRTLWNCYILKTDTLETGQQRLNVPLNVFPTQKFKNISRCLQICKSENSKNFKHVSSNPTENLINSNGLTNAYCSMWLLIGVAADRRGCWSMWLLIDVAADRCGCWSMWLLIDVAADQCYTHQTVDDDAHRRLGP
jgi:hypothetical protein